MVSPSPDASQAKPLPTSLAPAEAGTEVPRAPLWHILALVALLLVVAAVGMLTTHGQAPPIPESRIAKAYLPALLVNGMLALYVARLGRGRNALRELVGRRWSSVSRALVDVALAVLAAALILLTEQAWAAAFGAPSRAWSNAVLPASSREHAAWVLVAVSIGTSEELVYRGYLQRELGVLVRSRTLGLVAQALLFALAHGEQGAGFAARTLLYGLGFGVLAAARKSLIPGMLAHVGLDVAAGFVHRA